MAQGSQTPPKCACARTTGRHAIKRGADYIETLAALHRAAPAALAGMLCMPVRGTAGAAAHAPPAGVDAQPHVDCTSKASTCRRRRGALKGPWGPTRLGRVSGLQVEDHN